MRGSISQNPQYRKQCGCSLDFIDDHQSLEALQSCHWLSEADFVHRILKVKVMRWDRPDEVVGERRLTILPRSQQGHDRRPPQRVTKPCFEFRSCDQSAHPCILSTRCSKYKDVHVVNAEIPRRKAGDIIKNIAPIVGGTGGGRPDLAQAGGRDASKLDEALAKVAALLQ